MGCFGPGVVNSTLDNRQYRFIVFAVGFFTNPLRFPTGVIYLTTQPGGFGVLIKTEPRNRIEIRLQCDKAIQG